MDNVDLDKYNYDVMPFWDAKKWLSKVFLGFILFVLCLMQLIAAYMIYSGKAEFVAKQTYSITQKPDSSLPINTVNEEKQEKTNPTVNTVETSSISVVATEVSAEANVVNVSSEIVKNDFVVDFTCLSNSWPKVTRASKYKKNIEFKELEKIAHKCEKKPVNVVPNKKTGNKSANTVGGKGK